MNILHEFKYATIHRDDYKNYSIREWRVDEGITLDKITTSNILYKNVVIYTNIAHDSRVVIKGDWVATQYISSLFDDTIYKDGAFPDLYIDKTSVYDDWLISFSFKPIQKVRVLASGHYYIKEDKYSEYHNKRDLTICTEVDSSKLIVKMLSCSN